MDVKLLLKWYIRRRNFVDQHPGFEIKGQDKKVYGLERLSRLKQAQGAWYMN